VPHPDIPITLKRFSIWFSEKIIKRDKETYAFNDFIRDILIGLVQPIMNNICLQTSFDITKRGQNTKITPRISMFHREAQGKDDKIDPLTGSPKTYKELNKNGACKAQKLYKVHIRKENVPTDRAKRLFEYYFIYVTEEKPFYRKADYFKDQEEGIYHLFVGADSGLLKEVKFKQNSQPFYKEAIMHGTGLQWLKRLYDANVSMYGNNIFIPGMKVYIDPITIGLGRPNQKTSIAASLGLGGYYVVIKVEGSIEAGKFNTELTCKWESTGDGTGYKDDTGSSIDACIANYKKKSEGVGFYKGKDVRTLKDLLATQQSAKTSETKYTDDEPASAAGFRGFLHR